MGSQATGLVGSICTIPLFLVTAVWDENRITMKMLGELQVDLLGTSPHVGGSKNHSPNTDTKTVGLLLIPAPD